MINTKNNLANAQTNLLYLLIGGGIGATVALLFAPKPGRELRQDVSSAAKQGLEVANNTVTQLRESADTYYHVAQDKASDLYRVASKTVNDGSEAAMKFADKTLHRVKDNVQGIKNDAVDAAEEIAPHFDTADKRNLKTGIL
jgi:gas vesicle protein